MILGASLCLIMINFTKWTKCITLLEEHSKNREQQLHVVMRGEVSVILKRQTENTFFLIIIKFFTHLVFIERGLFMDGFVFTSLVLG